MSKQSTAMATAVTGTWEARAWAVVEAAVRGEPVRGAVLDEIHQRADHAGRWALADAAAAAALACAPSARRWRPSW